VQPAGTASLTVPANYGRIIGYRLVAVRGGIERTALLNVTVLCQFFFFFGDNFAPPDADCPLDSGSVGNGAFQLFERGAMIYVAAGGRNEIYGLTNDGARYVRYANNWDGSTLNEAPPPQGLFIPRQMLNWAYYNTLAPVGSWNQSIGWGIADIDTSQRSIQFESNQLRFYIDGPGGQVFRFVIQGSDIGTWTRIR
jgi:hypothetical protein